MPTQSDLHESTSDLSNSGLNPETPDRPPESFWVPRDQALEWLNHNAFIQRKGSTKITSSSNFNSTTSPSQTSAFDPRPKASIIGLPGRSLRRSFKPENARLFRSQSEPGGKPPASEPGSPRVSCMGRVSSRKGREKRSGFWAGLRRIFGTGLGTTAGSNQLDAGPGRFRFKPLVSAKKSELGGHDRVDGKRTEHLEESQ